MIRINLLPIKQDRRKTAGRNQLLIGAIILATEVGFAALLYLSTSADLNEQKNANTSVKSQVSRIEKQVEDHNNILKEIDEFQQRQVAIDDLQAARTGPVYVMLELSKILSMGGRPHMDNDKYQQLIQANPARSYDENWDYRRLWLTKVAEKDRFVKIEGQGMTHEDVAEFLRRINLSVFFVESELVSTKLASASIKLDGFKASESDPVVHFVLSGKVRYK